MKFRFVWIGKTRNRAVNEMVEQYLERVRKFAQVEVTQIRDRKDAATDVRRLIEKEGEEILSRTATDPFVVALDEQGKEMNSVELARFIEKHRLEATRQMTFIIGGHSGLSDQVRKRADFVLALSRMTLTHEFARALLMEQVYRAFTIIHDLPYQK